MTPVQALREDDSEAWKRALLPIDSRMHDAIRNLNESALQIALVVSDDGRLVGTITDGDIRRGLLRGLDMASPVESIVHRDPLVAPRELSRETALQLMQANKILQLPVVDGAGRVVGLHLWDALLVSRRDELMVIMAGGQGARLRPQTASCPKPMLPVAGKPMLEHIIERAKLDGFQHFVLAVHFLGHMVEEHFGDGSRWGVEIDYLREQTPLGTAGALRLLNPRPQSAFIVSNGDVLTDVSYAEVLAFHARHGAAATMTVRLHEWQHPFGVVLTEGVEIVGFDEKPVARSHINAGIYVLNPEALDVINPDEPSDMPTVFRRLKERGARTIVYPMHEPWLDVGRPEDLQQANSKSGS